MFSMTNKIFPRSFAKPTQIEPFQHLILFVNQKHQKAQLRFVLKIKKIIDVIN